MAAHFPQLKTKRLLLRAINKNDTENIYRGLSNPEVIKYYGVAFKTPEDTKQQMDWFDDIDKNNSGFWWAICPNDKTGFYGAAGLYNLQQEHKKAELGFWLLPEYWGKGIIQEALVKILHFAFNDLNLNRIEAFVESENIRSKKRLLNLEFKFEGTMQQCEFKNDRFINLEIYAIVKSNKQNEELI